LLVAFLTAILNSCQIEKRPGLYIACADMEAYFFADFCGRTNWPESRVGHGSEPVVFFRRQSFYWGNYITLAGFDGLLA
jgi:hypothetical protein